MRFSGFISFLGVFVLGICGTSYLCLANVKLRPHWATQPPAAIAPNESFLMDRKATSESNALREMIDPSRARSLHQRNEAILQEHESRRQAGRLDLDSEQKYAKQMSDFSKDLVNEIRIQQARIGRNKLDVAAKRNENVRPIATAGAITAICTMGEPINLQIGDETTLTTRMNLPDQKSELAISSPLMYGSFGISNKAPEVADPTVREERYRLSLSRGIPVLNLSSGVTYGSSTNTISASVSRPITNNVTAVLDSSRALDSAAPPIYSQDSVQLLYGVRF